MARRHRKSRKWIIGGMVLMLLIIAGIIVIVILNNNNQGNSQGDETEIPGVEKVESVEKSDEETEEEYSERMAEQKKVKQYEGEDPNKAAELSGAITHAGVNNGVLMIGVNIDQFLDDGNCELNLVRNGNMVYIGNASIVADVTTSSCDGFSIPASGLGNGNIEINIKLSSGGKTGIIKGEINI